jgi:hypothetical protein
MKKTKIIIVISSFLFSAFFLLSMSSSNYLYTYCVPENHCSFLSNIIESNIIAFLFYFSIPVFLFSLVTYFLKDEIFQIWLKFTYVWFSLSVFLVLITPGSSGSFFVSVWDSQMTAIFMSGLYLIISSYKILKKVREVYFIKKIKN